MSDKDFLQEVEQLADQLETESGQALSDIQADDDWSAIASWDQLKDIGNEDVSIGSHTVDHVRLGLVSADVAREQLGMSKRDIEKHMGKQCTTVCYPNGNYSDETIEIARECGYTCGVTTEEGLNTAGEDVMTLRRVNVPTHDSSLDLYVRACGLSQTFSQVKTCIKKMMFGQKQCCPQVLHASSRQAGN